MDMTKISTRKSRDEQLDAEIEEELKKFKPAEENQEPEEIPVTSKEEESWKKRYSDLRRYASQKEEELKREIADRERKLAEKIGREQGILPKDIDKETVIQWKKDYPDVFAVVSAVANEQLEHSTAELRRRVEELDNEKHELARERAFQQVLAVHPDFEELKESEDFQDWISNHDDLARAGDPISQAIVYALWENDTDANAANRAISIYKAEKGKKTRKAEDIAAPIRRSNVEAPTESDGKRRFRESEIAKMSNREYDQLEAEINLAQREGRIIYDLSAAGR